VSAPEVADVTKTPTVADMLPAVPAPPFDPRSLLLDGRAGWRAGSLAGVEIQPDCGTLALAPLPGTGPLLADPTGSFGGLTVPTGVAWDPEGALYFVDPAAGVIKTLDRCDCVARPLPCTGGPGRGPRQLREPHGLAVDRARLYVCDTGNGRVVVLSRQSLAVTAHWSAPAVPERPNPFAPFAAAADGRGRLWVTDANNGALVAFDRDGRVVASVTGLGTVRDLTIDLHGRLYVRVEGISPAVTAVDPDPLPRGTVVGPVVGPDSVRELFRPLPFVVDGAGRLDATGWCAPPAGCPPPSSWFDAAGNPTSGSAPPAPAFPAEGVYLSLPLDSGLYRCVWHRVVLDGELPRGTSIEVATFTAEAPYTPAQVAALPPSEWQTRQVARASDGTPWDCLVQSGAGRYLWLRLALRSQGRQTPRLSSAIVEFPRVSLRGYLPAIFGADPVGADFTDRFLAIFDTTLRSIEKRVDDVAALFDPLSAPATPDPATGRDFLDWLASWVGVSFDRSWSEARRRRWLKAAGALFARRGTPDGLRRQLLLFLGWGDDEAATRCRPCAPADRCAPPRAPCEGPPSPSASWRPPPLVLEHYRLRRWLFVGAGRLGDEAVLWGQRIVNRSQLGEGAQAGASQLISTQDPLRDPFHVFAHRFSVFVPARLARDEGERRSLERLVRRESPGHTQGQIEWVAPRFRIGKQSTIGFDSVVARLPQGVVLAKGAPLGQATVLTGGRGTDIPQVGATARIGGGAKLS
jgi:phage tail-like protein